MKIKPQLPCPPPPVITETTNECIVRMLDGHPPGFLADPSATLEILNKNEQP